MFGGYLSSCSLHAASRVAPQTGESAEQSQSPRTQIIFDYSISQEIRRRFSLLLLSFPQNDIFWTSNVIFILTSECNVFV